MTGGSAPIFTKALHGIRTDVLELKRSQYLKSARSRSGAKKRWNKENKEINKTRAIV